MGAARNVALSEMNLRGISINADTTTNTVAINVVPSDSGIIFINKENYSDVTYHLPAVATGAGKFWWFLNGQTTYNIIINAGTGSIFVGGNSAVANTMTPAGNLIGDCAMVVGDGTNYYLIEFVGTWSAA